jgi:hypothetical protein
MDLHGKMWDRSMVSTLNHRGTVWFGYLARSHTVADDHCVLCHFIKLYLLSHLEAFNYWRAASS